MSEGAGLAGAGAEVSQVDMADLALAPTGLGGRVRGARRPSFLMAFCFLFVIVVLICVIFGTYIAPHDANAEDLANSFGGPSWHHLMGTDALGRDIFSRTIVGARLAVIGPLVIAGGAMLIGNFLGTLSGYYGGPIDFTIMRWADLMFSLPGLLIAIVVVGVLGGGYWLAVITLMLLTAPYDARLIRATVLEQRPRPYVEALETLGLKKTRIMFFNIWPNVVPVVIANTFLNFAFSLVALAGLSYLGLGAAPGAAEWGRMISDNRNLLLQNPLAPLGPAIALVLTAMSMNLIGDWLYEWLSDRGRSR
jgi:peptide/nickel transport system permease protein